MSRNLSQIAADLLARPMESRELSDQIQRLGLEIRLVVQSEDTIFGRLRGILESLRTIVPGEKQRYQAALQALSTTTKLSRQEILQAMKGQLEELKIVESGIMSAQAGWRYGGNGIEARSQQLKCELAQLRERLTHLESEERAVFARRLAREKDLVLAEKTGKELFADIRAEIDSVQKKVEALTTEVTAAQPAPPAPQVPPASRQQSPKKELRKSDAPDKKKDGAQKAGIKAASPRQDTKFRRKCPMCGGPFHLLELEKIWQCFTCAHEEPAMDAIPGAGEEMSESTAAQAPAEGPGRAAEAISSAGEPAAASEASAASKKGLARAGSQPAARKKTCPVCFKKMIWSPGEKVWRCPSGHHERK